MNDCNCLFGTDFIELFMFYILFILLLDYFDIFYLFYVQLFDFYCRWDLRLDHHPFVLLRGSCRFCANLGAEHRTGIPGERQEAHHMSHAMVAMPTKTPSGFWSLTNAEALTPTLDIPSMF